MKINPETAVRSGGVRGWLAGWFRGGALRRVRALRLCEMLPLGEKRFVAVVAFERQRFLIGSGGGALVMLATLPDRTPVCDEGGAAAGHSWKG